MNNYQQRLVNNFLKYADDLESLIDDWNTFDSELKSHYAEEIYQSFDYWGDGDHVNMRDKWFINLKPELTIAANKLQAITLRLKRQTGIRIEQDLKSLRMKCKI